MRYRATFNTAATVTVDIEVPDEVVERHTDPDDGVNVGAIEEWAADHAHDLAGEHIETWGIYQPVLLDMSIDGIGADTVEPIEEETR